ncbi:putative cytochrome P450 [Rosellinia necatrix]|uniref:Putative cytochrome P450 n=1 Tax=Rosellinia necatrix TaxID=77044 RepID=A0A1W2TFZ2_ROSNE|nr:putative cytochrome P450 [Rosellinia necatrix]
MEVTLELLKSYHLYPWGILGIGAVLLFFASSLKDPLSKVPGPLHARFTDLVSNYYWVTGNKPTYIHSLHVKYGPIVRVGPREVYIADIQAAQRIFAIKNEFPKSTWYRDFVPTSESVFNTLDKGLHRRFRRLLSSPLSESGLKTFLPQIDGKVTFAIQRMKEEYEARGAVDVYKWWLFMATDVIGELSFGESFRMLESGKVNQYVKDLQTIGKVGSYQSVVPSLFRYSIRFGIPIPLLNKARMLSMRMVKYATESLGRHQDLVGKSGSDTQPTVFTKIYKAEDDDSISPAEIMDNAQSYIVAGSDTTSNTLAYLVWSVCRAPEVKARLVKELERLPADFAYEDLRDLVYLDHVIDETLRRFPTVPAGLPREVPVGGAEMCGHHIPAGYTVSAQSYSIHRDPVAFPDPEKFDPSRWENPTKMMKDAFMAFGGGSRICIGLHLAKIELRLGTARFFKAFPNAKVSTLEGMSEEEMAPAMFFSATPIGNRCLIEL